MIDCNVACISKAQHITNDRTIFTLNRSNLGYIVILLQSSNCLLESFNVAIHTSNLIYEKHMRSPCRDLDCSYAVSENQDNVLIVILNAAEHRISLITFISCSLAIIFPGLSIIVRNVPVAVSYFKLRRKTVLTIFCDSKNSIIILVEHPLVIDGPIPTTIFCLLHADNWRVSVLSFLTMINLYASALCKENLIADLDSSLHDRKNLINVILLLKCFNNSLK